MCTKYWPHTFVSPFADSRGVVVSYWIKYVHKVLANSCLPRKSVVRLADHPNMTLDVYHGHKTTTQHNNNNKSILRFGKHLLGCIS